jgi:hypothetical protein
MPPAQLAHSFRDGVAALPIEAYRHQLLSLKCKLSLQASLIKKRPLQMKSINFGLWSFKKQTSIMFCNHRLILKMNWRKKGLGFLQD